MNCTCVCLCVCVAASAEERNLGPKELLEKRRQKKRRDTAVRYFRTHRGLYEAQEDRSLRTGVTCVSFTASPSSRLGAAPTPGVASCPPGRAHASRHACEY